MVVKKIPLRSCCLTKERLPKKELFRIVRTPEQTVVVDLKGKVNGHGAYLKKDRAVIEQASKCQILDKKLEIKVPEEIYKELLDLLANE